MKVDPTTDNEGSAPGDGRDIEVIMMCGIRYCSCSVVIAFLRVSISTILTPDKVLCASVQIRPSN